MKLNAKFCREYKCMKVTIIGRIKKEAPKKGLCWVKSVKRKLAM